MPARTVFLAGHARLPQASTAQSIYRDLVVTVEIEPQYSVIVRASCNLVTELGREFIARMLIGRSLQTGIDDVIAEVQGVYQGAVQNAVIAALKDLARRYEAWRQSCVGYVRRGQELPALAVTAQGAEGDRQKDLAPE